MNHQILQRYIDSHNFPIIEKSYHKYLTFESLEEDFTYILKEGIVKQSVLSKYGMEFNLRYVTGLEITSVLNTGYSKDMREPYNVRIESETASFYKVRHSTFLRDISEDIELQGYVKDFYHYRLQKSMKKMQCMLTNGRIGAISTQIYDLMTLFGRPLANGHILIDFIITNEELGKFCGISTASSVSRLLKQLKKEGIIQIQDQHIIITNLEKLKDNIVF
ncbi:TPA: Crp/Fnr family transcriptional regulator [Streptococcus equi subsp. zooepidemicus]|nr:Crp/Fnr family transcriptional regulator [Streptococcus equi subsp. zooepidemicus]HEL0039981.1 Crp/Fnr family transcriptional regulator [Streptococcus equi subsp. zooepidemicus]HEL0041963.1 Crp/Fnr family transcriptional regulator [Streptococcus equi subsp. zooepidemicus]HEL0043963.1 Crp/Fnr family transcriptional regulator [Streptococcus equi subsp. zooepidemicus]HEL0051961.1 Crp/Fnr family transcriptional regulator [Streptococcus equi subsp. zooepidemicus]